jgi:soluble lytic murein transglycosylase-like protein
MTIKTLVPLQLTDVRLCGAVIGALTALAAGSAGAQVIEIGSQGAVTVYDGPAVVTSNGVASISRAPAVKPARRLNVSAPLKLSGAISDAARASDLSAALIAAIAWRESNFSASAVSRAGALGEMQLLPETARQLGVDPKVSRQNIAGGAAYVRALLQRYHGDLIKTLAAYNAGPKAVDRYGGVPPFKETQAYVAAVLDRLSQDSLGDESVTQGVKRPPGLLLISESGR